MSTDEPPIAASLVQEPELLELTHALRGALLRRGEYLAPEWVEEAAHDLRIGALAGWVARGAAPALAFLSARPRRAYGHIHAVAGPGAPERATRLLATLAAHLPEGVRRFDVGITGLDDDGERAVGDSVSGVQGWRVVERWAMDRDLRTEPLPPEFHLPSGAHRVSPRTIQPSALGALDWAGFQGTPDEGFVAETAAEDARLLAEIQEGRLGRFLDEASAASVLSDGQMTGLVLTAEQSPTRAVLLDVVVHPAHRRQGLGRALVTFAVRACAALGYAQLRLWVTSANRPAASLYEATGFRRAERARIYRWDRSAPEMPAQSQRER